MPGVGSVIARTLIAELPRARHPRQARHRRPRRARALDAPVRTLARQELHRRRPRQRPDCPVLGRARREPPPIPRSRPSATSSSHRASPKWSHSSPPPESSSPSSTQSSGTARHGRCKTLDAKDSRSPPAPLRAGRGEGARRQAARGGWLADALDGVSDPAQAGEDGVGQGAQGMVEFAIVEIRRRPCRGR